MVRKLFGTDGIRGLANKHPMTPETALRAAQAAGLHFVSEDDRRHVAIIAKDTRLSGYMLEPAMVAGFTSVGMDVVLCGPLPTPAVAMLTRSMRADVGVMLSASHNPFHDNGIKLFGPDGFKLSDEIELHIEGLMANLSPVDYAASDKLGRARRLDDVDGRYIEIVKATFPRELSLEGLKIVVDCAHGAAYQIAPRVLYELGAEVIPVAVSPNGFNINDKCGATEPAAMAEVVKAEGADIGLALDGDADRLIVADENGAIVDGDQLMGVLAASLSEAGQLTGGSLVATVMSNMGLERYLAARNIGLERTAVGDRYVLERMKAGGFNLGGEQSGHMIFSDHATTGDGMIAALQVLALLVRQGRRASEVLRVFDPMPQLLKNVRYTGASPLDEQDVKGAIKSGEDKLSGTGRVLIRKSGTEPKIRVMAEGEDEALITSVVNDIAAEIQRFAN